MCLPCGRGRRRLADLVDRGLLTLVAPHDCVNGVREAHGYRLIRPSPNYRTSLRREVTTPRSITHPLWGQLGQSVQFIWQKLSDEPRTTTELSLLTGQGAGSLTHGVRRGLLDLEPLGWLDGSAPAEERSGAKADTRLTRPPSSAARPTAIACS